MIGAIVLIFRESEIPFFKFLKEFGHVICYIQYDDKWIIFNPNYSRTDLSIIAYNDLMCTLSNEKHYIITSIKNNRKPFIPMFSTCVGFAKSIIGIYKPFIFTPKQLYKYLKRNN